MPVNPPLLTLAPELKARVAAFPLPTPLGFGQVMAPLMAMAQYQNGAWTEAKLVPYAPLSFDPACKFLHYGQQVFEGLKAFALATGGVGLFRPRLNHARLNASAARLAMPEIPEALFMQSLISLVHHLHPLIPQGAGESLYLRPLYLATDVGLSLKPSATYLFLVMASPSGAYFAPGEVTALIEREDCRAAPGGTGAYKVAGNYAAATRSDLKAARSGCQQTLWLDAVHKTHVEEFSGMNVFAVIDGELTTPPVSDTILPGITRASILELAASLQIPVRERPLAIDALLAAIDHGRCSEVFACGTAAVITPVHALAEANGTKHRLQAAETPISSRLRELLLAMQTGHVPAPAGWLETIPATSDRP